jgi:hypothetical protein
MAIWDRLTYVERNYQRHLLHTIVTLSSLPQRIAAQTVLAFRP